jgi:hypothetical protein
MGRTSAILHLAELQRRLVVGCLLWRIRNDKKVTAPTREEDIDKRVQMIYKFSFGCVPQWSVSDLWRYAQNMRPRMGDIATDDS